MKEIGYYLNSNLVLGIDIQDDLGRHEVGFHENTFKTPENNGAGCRINATFKIARVPGNFHISTHSAPTQPTTGDMRHVIHELNFGDSVKVRWIEVDERIYSICFFRVFDEFQIEKHSDHYEVSIIQTVQLMFRMIIY